MGAANILAYAMMAFMLIEGIALMFGKGTWILYDYHKLSDKEKKQLDFKKISRKRGITMVGIAVALITYILVNTFSTSDTIRQYSNYGVIVLLGFIIFFSDVWKHK